MAEQQDNSTPASSARSQSELELLAAMSRHFAESLDIQHTIEHALSLIARYVNAEGGALFLLEDDGRRLVCKASVGPVDIKGIALDVGEGIVGHCVRYRTAEIVRDVRQVPNFHPDIDERSGFTTQSVLCASMIVKDAPIGAIEVVNKRDRDGQFTEADRMMLQTLASSAALAIHNAQMTVALMEQERMRRELELASEIQRSLLPRPRLLPFPVHGLNVAAGEVSGDFYDFFELPDGRICFAVGDVSGKGMNAALLMSKTASLFRCLGKSVPEPGALLARINNEIFETTSHGMFVTMMAGVFDPASSRVCIANAGHEPALIHRGGEEFAEVAAQAPPLGVLPLTEPEPELPEEDVELASATLYAFTDGITEAPGDDGKPLGREGLKKHILDHAHLPVDRRVRALGELLAPAGHRRHDDLTLLAIQGPDQASS